MCDYCMECYHPGCIGTAESEDMLKAMPSFKCPVCRMNTRRNSPLYREGLCILYLNTLNTVSQCIKCSDKLQPFEDLKSPSPGRYWVEDMLQQVKKFKVYFVFACM